MGGKGELFVCVFPGGCDARRVCLAPNTPFSYVLLLGPYTHVMTQILVSSFILFLKTVRQRIPM